jgi:hypothetical protein
MDTPFFPDWRARLAAFGKRLQSLRAQPLPHLEKLFSPILPAGLLAQAESGANSRQRFYPLRCTFWGFLWQALNPGAPCREAARQIQALFCSAGQAGPVDKEGSAYCTARKRLPLEILQRARVAAADQAEKLLHQARPHDLREGIRLGRNDRLVVWHKPPQKPRYLPKALWRRIPEELIVRVLRLQAHIPGFRTKTVALVTTLSDAQDYPTDELAALYLRRWRIELWWRHLKISLGMDVLRCQSPAMIHKELEMYLIGYNLIRGLMAEAAARHGQPVEQLSFKGSVDAVRQYSPLIAQARSGQKQRRLMADLLRVLALDLAPERPGRREPRAVKRRPKPYPLLTEPRQSFQEIPHRSSYRKAA